MLPAPDAPAPSPLPRSIRPVAVIDIGSTSIRMALGEINELGAVRTLETLSQVVSLGKDTFTLGYIRKSTIEECARVLRSYRRILAEYQITDLNQVRIVATSAVREATNRLAFVDRLYIATGMHVEPLDEAEVNRITYSGIQPLLQAEPSLAAANTIVMEVGGGSTELLLVQNGNIEFSYTYRLGSLRLRKLLEQFRTPTVKVRKVMESHIRKTVEEIGEHVPQAERTEMIALGGDMRFAATHLLSEWNPLTLGRIPRAALERFADRMLSMTDDQIVRKYHLSFPDAETVGPALLTYALLARVYNLSHVMVTNTNLRDGLLHEMAIKEAWDEDFKQQIIRSAIDLGQKFHIDEDHAKHVAELSKKLFAALQAEHQLAPKFETLLYVASLLHEIGLFVSNRSYHKHTLYLIRNSELFGLSKKDLLLVALAARYHRRASPQPTHEGYLSLDRDQRVSVSKMAALLRIADALDDSRSGRIHDFRCEFDEGRLVISIANVEDLSLEQLALNQTSTLFEEIFGTPVLLRTVG